MEGRRMPAARESRRHLEAKLGRLAEQRALALPVPTLADIMWASAHAAALLVIAAAPRAPAPAAIGALRDAALTALTRERTRQRRSS
jgi:hypothetical protein